MKKQDVERELPIQIIRSGAGISANLSEAVYGSRRRDFFSKPRIALKEYFGPPCMA
ncbi:four helix bundle protein [Akkermansia muciniphila]|uniref:four helix bundle protein n=1 Tax=Akkermansia muciniphila TaxID=239935 RepID=UPI000AA25764|nr:four helix bundle protein [Akkermansia muciniphila]MBS5974502.1 four helix bundle protein [Akkermansia muciniphila]MBT8787445.1 four helix bundle protein [Akkermansia muciniphila]QWP50899.1 four helix bundle protein [Akkermansia muciniphila]QWP55764.1 four helix bundle protein [Akkermansia muciniphila]QWP58080.1 four helix bundle protein [Akkermansia muciniphila]